MVELNRGEMLEPLRTSGGRAAILSPVLMAHSSLFDLPFAIGNRSSLLGLHSKAAL